MFLIHLFLFNAKLTDYQHIFEFLEGYIYERKPANLYDPVNYILKLGGKRLRPLLPLWQLKLLKMFTKL